ESGLVGLGLDATSATEFMRWHVLQLATGSLIPAIWLVFSLTYGRANYKEFLAQWKWAILGAFVIPIILISFFRDAMVVGKPLIDEAGAIFLKLGWSGYVIHLLSLLGAIVILMNLERTLRHSSGRTRWQVKFMVLGVGSLFGIHIYTDSQVVLYRLVSTNLEIVQVGVLLLADLLVIVSLVRARLLKFDFYVSHTVIYNSFSLMLVGIYFILVGIMARLVYTWRGASGIPVLAFVLFVGIVGISVLFMSDRFRLRRKRFISRYFKRPVHDYQRVWRDFTQKTAAMTQTRELCSILARMVSETLDALSVTIWLVDEQSERLNFAGSTVLSEADANKLRLMGRSGAALAQVMRDRPMPIHVAGSTDAEVEELRRLYGADLDEARIKYSITLNAAGRFVGLMTVSDKVGAEHTLSPEDYDLLKTIADQAAANLLSLRLSEHLRQAKELEAFQAMSAFFMHDLKNLASKLSLVTQNLPMHFDNPEFRDDALRAVSQSVSKINGMCTRLSLLSQKLELRPKESDLNQFVEQALSELDTYLKVPVVRELQPISPLAIDPEQMQKVIVNLVMNAQDAVADDGQIKVYTDYRDGWAELSVKDNGSGMSEEFVKKRLFRPFNTTKKQGMGIGLFHCKTIVEAHGGRIEVESEEGKGTTFRVLLPAKQETR
ncbi:MAG TPA: XrtA/PEP-CTERM system histidine kinase PrsK, partial [Syntrophorhabdales bacterium]|nr:XrtA/PEP-CTERM system histidine kinase PrsK [Syntrophorhabdales bacterium]